MKKIIIATALIVIAAVTTVILYFFRNPLCFGVGCTGGYSFHDTATFAARNSRLGITVISTGSVPEGADLGEGKGFVKMYSTSNSTDTMFLKTSPENIDTITYKGKTIPFNCSQMERDKFYDYLVSAGYTQLDKNEIAELRDAMTLINYRHKAGFREGQTRFITVGKQKRHTD